MYLNKNDTWNRIAGCITNIIKVKNMAKEKNKQKFKKTAILAWIATVQRRAVIPVVYVQLK